ASAAAIWNFSGASSFGSSLYWPAPDFSSTTSSHAGLLPGNDFAYVSFGESAASSGIAASSQARYLKPRPPALEIAPGSHGRWQLPARRWRLPNRAAVEDSEWTRPCAAPETSRRGHTPPRSS